MRRNVSSCITDMHDMARSCAASRDYSDKSSEVVSAALLKFTAEAARLGYSERGAQLLFGQVLVAGQARRRRRITREVAFARIEQMAAALPFAPLGGAS